MDVLVTLNREYKDLCKIPHLDIENINQKINDRVIRMHLKPNEALPADDKERRKAYNKHSSKLVAIKLPDPVFRPIPRIWKKFE